MTFDRKTIQRRHFATLACLFVGTALCVGCPAGTQTKAVTQPFAGQTQTVVVPRGLKLKESWDVAINDWQAQSAGTVAITEQAAAPGQWQPGPPGAIELFPLTEYGTRLAAGPLAEIPDSSRAAGMDTGDRAAGPDIFDHLQGLREHVIAPGGGKARILPVSAPVLVLYYRSDLLMEAELKPPRTWDDYRSLLKSLPTWAPGLVAVEPWAESFRSSMFLARAVSMAKHPANYSVFFDSDNARPLVDSPPFERTLSHVVEDLPRLAPESLTATPRDCRNHILSGKAALAISFETGPTNTAWALAPAEDTKPVQRASGVQLGFVPLPGSTEAYDMVRRRWEQLPGQDGQHVAYTGFTGLAVCVAGGASGRETEMAWNLAGTLWGNDILGQLPGGTVSPTRESTLGDTTLWAGSDLVGDESQRYVQTVGASLRHTQVVLELPVIRAREFRDALTRHLGTALSGEVAPPAALEACAADWQAIVRASEPGKVRDSYRESLGLRPIVR